MATTVVFSDASDGQIKSTNAAYLTARSGGTLVVTGTNLWIGEDTAFSCYETFISFDTTGLTGAVSATLSLMDNTFSAIHTFGIEVRLNDFGPAIETTDWVPGANLGALPLLATSDVTAWSGPAYHDFTDVAMVANLNTAGATRFLLHTDHLRLGDVPTNSNWVVCEPSETAGTTKDPKLTVVVPDPIASFGPVRARVAPQARLG